MKDHHINIFYSKKDNGYIAEIPDLRYCSAFGRTPAEPVMELEKAEVAWIEATLAAGKPVPKPRYRPAIYHSGRA